MTPVAHIPPFDLSTMLNPRLCFTVAALSAAAILPAAAASTVDAYLSVPEPSTWGTFVLAVGGLLAFTIRRRRS